MPTHRIQYLPNIRDVAYFPSSAAVSRESKQILINLRHTYQHLRDTMQIKDLLDLVASKIEELQQYLEENWDGYDAKAISIESIIGAIIFVSIQPDSIPIPDFVPEPEGQMGLEWYNPDKKKTFIISFNEQNMIEYAGIFEDGAETYGSELYTYEIPKTIIDSIIRTIS